MQLGSLVGAMGQATKRGNLDDAYAVYKQAQQEPVVKLPLHSYNALLYLTVGGDGWEALARGGDPHTCAVHNINPSAPITAPPPPPPSAAVAAAAADGNPNASKISDNAAPVQGGGAATGVQAKPTSSLLTTQQRVELAKEVWGHIQAQGLKPDQASYLALARLEGVQGKADQALQVVRETTVQEQHQATLVTFGAVYWQHI